MIASCGQPRPAAAAAWACRLAGNGVVEQFCMFSVRQSIGLYVMSVICVLCLCQELFPCTQSRCFLLNEAFGTKTVSDLRLQVMHNSVSPKPKLQNHTRRVFQRLWYREQRGVI